MLSEKLSVTREEVSYDEARAWCYWSFDAKYGDVVSIYTIGETGKRGEAKLFSRVLWRATRQKHKRARKIPYSQEEACSAGIRRIKAIFNSI